MSAHRSVSIAAREVKPPVRSALRLARVGALGWALFTLVSLAAFDGTPRLDPLEVPELHELHRFRRQPAAASVGEALRQARGAAARYREVHGEASAALGPDAAVVHAIGARVDARRCVRADVERLDALLAARPDDSPRTRALVARLRDEASRCGASRRPDPDDAPVNAATGAEPDSVVATVDEDEAILDAFDALRTQRDGRRWRRGLRAVLSTEPGRALARQDRVLHARVLDAVRDSADGEARRWMSELVLPGLPAVEGEGLRRWAEARSLRQVRGGAPRAQAALARIPEGATWAATERRYADLVALRRDDEDRAALALVQVLLADGGGHRRVDLLDACAHLAGRLGELELQRGCVDELVDRGEVPASMKATAAARHLGDVWGAAGPPSEVGPVSLASLATLWSRPGLVAAFDAGGPVGRARHAYWDGRLRDAAGAGEGRAAYERAWREAPLSIWGIFAEARLMERGRGARSADVVRRAASRPLTWRPGAGGDATWELLQIGMPRAALANARRELRAPGAPTQAQVDFALVLLAAHGALDESLWLGSGRHPLHRRSLEAWEETSAAALRAAWPIPFRSYFRAASVESGVPAALLAAIARRESHFRPRVRSVVGARGLMQVRPATAREVFGELAGLEGGASLYDPEVSIRVGGAVLAGLGRRFDGCIPVMAAAYATGPNRVGRWVDRAPGIDVDLWLERVPYPVIQNYAIEAAISTYVHAVLLGEDTPRLLCQATHVARRRRAAPTVEPDTAVALR